MDRTELADFLRRRRASLQPEDVGLPRGPRRRTRGLRREEVALLSAMSTDYYARLEQRRGPQPSEQMAAAIARGLRLSTDERDYLFRLTGHGTPTPAQREEHISPALLCVLARLDDTPALIISDLAETMVQNRLATVLLGDQTRFSGFARSAFYRWFTNPEERLLHPEADHQRLSALHVANLRTALSRDPGGRALAIVDALRERSTEFVRLWAHHDIAAPAADHKTIVHPELGEIELDCQLLFAENRAQALLILTASPNGRYDGAHTVTATFSEDV